MKERYERPIMVVENLMLNQAVASCDDVAAGTAGPTCRTFKYKEISDLITGSTYHLLHDYAGNGANKLLVVKWNDKDGDGLFEADEAPKSLVNSNGKENGGDLVYTVDGHSYECKCFYS